MKQKDDSHFGYFHDIYNWLEQVTCLTNDSPGDCKVIKTMLRFCLIVSLARRMEMSCSVTPA